MEQNLSEELNASYNFNAPVCNTHLDNIGTYICCVYAPTQQIYQETERLLSNAVLGNTLSGKVA